jgi:hypothetical protein
MDDVIRLTFRHPTPVVPADAGLSSDLRPLAILFRTLALTADSAETSDRPPSYRSTSVAKSIVKERTARPIFGINHVIAYGQSLASGWEGWPALSVQPKFNSLMLGQSIRPADEHLPQWRPVGAAGFQPLTATVQAVGSGVLLSPADVAALPQGDVALGETLLESAVNMWRARLQDDPDFAAARHALLASSCGVGGRTIEELSRNAQPELFNRLRDCASLAKAAARAGGHTVSLRCYFCRGRIIAGA